MQFDLWKQTVVESADVAKRLWEYDGVNAAITSIRESIKAQLRTVAMAVLNEEMAEAGGVALIDYSESWTVT
jgi:hypothetical protein